MQRVKVEVELTRSALATAMLNSKTAAQAASGCGMRPLHYVTRSPGEADTEFFLARAVPLRNGITDW